jgi:hypothetical protein
MKTKFGRLAGSAALAKPVSTQPASMQRISREKRMDRVKAKRLANGNAKAPDLGCLLPQLPVAIPPQHATQFY